MPSQEQTKFVVRLNPDLHQELVKLAQEKDRSLNSQIAFILKGYFDPQALRDRLAELDRTLH